MSDELRVAASIAVICAAIERGVRLEQRAQHLRLDQPLQQHVENALRRRLVQVVRRCAVGLVGRRHAGSGSSCSTTTLLLHDRLELVVDEVDAVDLAVDEVLDRRRGDRLGFGEA